MTKPFFMGTVYSAIDNSHNWLISIHVAFLCCSVFIISQFTTTTQLVTVKSSGSLTTTVTVTVASAFLGIPVVLGQHDVVLLPWSKEWDGMKGVFFALLLCSRSSFSPRHLHRFMPIMSWILKRVLLFGVQASANSFMLISVMVFVFCFQVPMWLPCLPKGIAPLQPFGVYPWQAYVSPGAGPWPHQGSSV